MKINLILIIILIFPILSYSFIYSINCNGEFQNKTIEGNNLVKFLQHNLTIKELATAANTKYKKIEIYKDYVDFCGSTVKNLNLSKMIFKKITFNKMDLSGSSFKKANLSNSTFHTTNLSNCNFDHANLKNSEIYLSDLTLASFDSTDLSNSSFKYSKFYKTDVRRVDLGGANLTGVRIEDSNILGSNLEKADISYAKIIDSELDGSNLSGASLHRSTLSNTSLQGVKLVNSDLWDAVLRNVELIDTDLEGANFWGVDLTGSTYEAISVPKPSTLGNLTGLSTVKFRKGKQNGLVLLRGQLRAMGLRALEREATYAIEKNITANSNRMEKFFRLIFFELPVGYGLNFGRPLIIILTITISFSFFYFFPIYGMGKFKIYKHSNKTSFKEKYINGRKEKEIFVINSIDEYSAKSFISAINMSIYFSILSTFNIGWREINLGTWISRLQMEDYILKSSGWVRTVSGCQSIICVYLLGLWILSYFGRPFG